MYSDDTRRRQEVSFYRLYEVSFSWEPQEKANGGTLVSPVVDPHRIQVIGQRSGYEFEKGSSWEISHLQQV